MFENIIAAPTDPIFRLTDMFNTDKRLGKVNLGIGVYKDETGNIPVLTSVKKAEQYLLEHENTKNYLRIDGITEFCSCTKKLLFGKDSAIIKDQRAHVTQTPGGTSALRIAADFLANKTSVKQVWVSNPSWPNHKHILMSAGLKVREYPYYDAINHSIAFERLVASFKEAKAGDVVLFQGCCHNTTGVDFTIEEWEELAKLSVEQGLLPLFDLAYQGFSCGIEEDAKGLRAFAAVHKELIIASSYSKNFCLYNERVGACTLVAENKEIVSSASSQIKSIIRATYSNPPAHGALVIAYIMNNDMLHSIWENELTYMRNRIQHMRKLFVNTLAEQIPDIDLSFIIKQTGMFSLIGLTKKQILQLRDDFGVYVLASGRVNFAGMTQDNMALLCKYIAAVLK